MKYIAIIFGILANVNARFVPQSVLTPNDQEDSPFNNELDAFIKDTLNHYHVPGLSIAIIDGNETHSRGYGYSQYSPDIKVTPETIFYGASTTKAFTAAALSFLVDDDDNYPNVQWTTPISQLLRDDFVLLDEHATAHITLQDALTHRTGLPRHDRIIQSGRQPVRDVVRSLRYLPLTAEPRTEFQYCNLMYVVLGHVVSVITHRWLGAFLREKIFEPLGMSDTYFDLQHAIDSGKPFAKGHMWLHKNETFMQTEYLDNASMEGAGAVLSTALDYVKWVRMFLNPINSPISERMHKALLTPQMIEGQRFDTESYVLYAYGWSVDNYRGHEIFWHGGAETGFGSMVLFIPSLSWGVVMLSNSYYTSALAQDILMWHLVDARLGVPSNQRLNHTEAIDDLLRNDVLERNVTYMIDEVYPPSSVARNIPPTLSLKSYAGRYSHPAYGPWIISHDIKNSLLRSPMDRGPVLQFTDETRLEHISGDHFLMVAYETSEPEDPLYVRAEFVVGLSGQVVKMGLELEDLGGDKIWFDRMQEKS